jgi:gliding motility-associated-like protein
MSLIPKFVILLINTTTHFMKSFNPTSQKVKTLFCFIFLLFTFTQFTNAQCIAVDDCDGDGILNVNDLDDDNDGILDTDEGYSETVTNYLANPSFENNDPNVGNQRGGSYLGPGTGNVGIAVDNWDLVWGTGDLYDNATRSDFAASDGSYYVGFHSGDGNSDSSYDEDSADTREVLIHNLETPLQAGVQYTLSFDLAAYDFDNNLNNTPPVEIEFYTLNDDIAIEGDDDGDGVPNYSDIDYIDLNDLYQDGNIEGDLATGNSGITYQAKMGSAGLYDVDGWSSATFTFTPSSNIDRILLTPTSGSHEGVFVDNFTLVATGATFTSIDTDGDGIADHLDTDSDNDGCNDADEAYGFSGTDSNSDGTYGDVITSLEVDSNGLVTAAGVTGTSYNTSPQTTTSPSGNKFQIATVTSVDATALQDKSVVEGNGTTFTITSSSATSTVTYTTPGTPDYTSGQTNVSISLQYQWQENGSNISDGGVYSGTNTNTLSISEVSGLDGNVYNLVITHPDNICIENQNSATLTVLLDTDGDGIEDDVDTDDDDDGNPDTTDPNPLTPTAIDENASATLGVATNINILGNDDFLPNNDLSNDGTTTITQTGGTAGGTVVLDALTGELAYTPLATEAGSVVTVIYYVCNTDPTSDVCATATVNITVTGGTTDTDGDGTFDSTDTDDDNDGVLDDDDNAPLDPSSCQDLDGDGCDDCSATASTDFTAGANFDPSNDGTDTDGDGICDNGDLDDDNDGILDTVECIDESGFINITPDVLRTYSSAFSVASGSGRVLDYSESNIDISAEFGFPVGSIILDVSNISEDSAQTYWATDVTDPGNNGAYPNFTFSGTKALYFRALHGPNIPTAMAYDGIISGDGTFYEQTASLEAQFIEDSSVPNEYRVQRTTSTGDTSNSPNFFTWNSLSTTSSITFTTTNDTPTGVTSRYDLYVVPQIDSDGDGIGDCFDSDSDNDGCNDVLESDGTDNDVDGILDGDGFNSDGQVTTGGSITDGYDGATGNETVATETNIDATALTDQLIITGGSTTFEITSATATSTETFTGTAPNTTPDYTTGETDASSGLIYQWQENGVNLTDIGVYSNTSGSGATPPTLTISDVTGLDGNEYSLVVTHTDNICIENTNSATLYVDADNDSDGIGDTTDLDDDNDGILDSNECLGFVEITPADFGLTNNTTGNNVTNQDLSANFGYPAGSVVITLTNTNVHSGGRWYTTSSAVPKFESTGSIDVTVRVVHGGTISGAGTDKYDGVRSIDGTQYNQKTALDATKFVEDNSIVNEFRVVRITNSIENNNSAGGDFIWDSIGSATDFEVLSNGAGQSQFDIFLEAECNIDTDGDGTTNDLDNDSDNDGCFDVLESGGTDANNDGVLDGDGFNSNGQVTTGGSITDGYDGVTGNETVATEANVDATALTDQLIITGGSTTFEITSATATSTETFTGTAPNTTPDYTTGETDVSVGLIYQWQENGVNLTDTGIYSNTSGSGATPPTLTISDVTGLDGNEYTLVVTHADNTCIENTNSATLNVDPDNDSDGIGDTTDLDDDNDGITDTDEGMFASVSEEFDTPPASGSWTFGTNANGDNQGDVSHSTDTVTNADCDFSSIPSSPGGEYILATDPAGGPTYFNGDVSSFSSTELLNGSLSFYWINGTYNGSGGQDGTQNIQQVVLQGSALSVKHTFDATGIYNAGWQLIQIDLDSSSWVNDSNGSTITDTDLDNVLSSLTNIIIEVETGSGRQISPSTCADAEYMALDDLVLTSLSTDTDGDGTPNYLDLDSDADGCSDADEAYNNIDADDNDTGVYGPDTPTLANGGVDANGLVILAGVTGNAYNTIPATTAGGLNTFEEGMTLAIDTAPSNEIKCETETAQFDAVASAVPVGTNTPVATASTDVTYQWSVSTDGINYSNLASETGTVASGTTVSLELTNVTNGMNGNIYRVVFTNEANICFAEAEASLTVTSSDDASFSYDAATYCVDASDPTPTITGLSGGTFSSAAGLSITAGTGVIDVSASTPGAYTVTYTTAGTCPNSSTASVTINALDDASFSYGAGAYCVDASDPTPTITGLTGGTFSSTAGLSINSSTGEIDVSASTPATYTVTYTTAGTCPNSSTASVTINALDDAGFSYGAGAYCADASDPTPTITGLSGGTFSSTAGLSINSSTGEIDVSASTPATYTVTYTTSGMCPNSSTASVTINALDDASFSYDAAAYCVDATDPTPTITGLSGGTFSSAAGLSITAGTGVIDVSASTPGTYTVTYTTSGTCPNSSATSLTINALDDASFSYDAAAYCVDATDPTPTITGLSGGAFSSAAGLSITAGTGVIDVSASTPGTYAVTYTTSGTCPNSSATSVTINALDDASFSYGAGAYCVDASDPTPTITGLTGGTFSSAAGLSINSSTGVIDVSASTPGTYTVTYTTAGTCPNSSTASVTINALDDASFSYGAGSYCVDASDPTPTITGLTGGTFSSTAGLSINSSTGAIDVSASAPATYTVTYTTAGTCPNSSTASVTINNVPNAPTITGDGLLCNSETTTLATTATGTIVWSSDTPGVASIDANTGVVTAVSAGTTNITYKVSDGNSCSTESPAFTVTVSCIDAVINDFTATPVDGVAGGSAGDVTANDTLNGSAVDDTLINITLDNDGGLTGVTIDADGNVIVPADTDSGNYTLTYTICEIAVPSNCDTTTVDIVVDGTIDAVINDFTAAPVDGVAGGSAGDVTANDTLNGSAVDDTLINITLDNDGGLTGVTIDANGNVIVPADTDSGNYTLTYTICEIAVPSNCDTTTVDIVVDGTIDAVINDFTASPVDSVAGGSAGDVTANDTLNGSAVDDTLINITLDNDGGLTGVTIDANGNVIVPADTDSGNYTLTYTLCEIAVPSNCDTTTVDIVVDGTIDAVINDFTASPVDGVAGGTAGDVTANDTLNGTLVDDTLINITLDNDGGLTGVTIDADGNVIVPADTDSGNYTLTYTICEIAVPSNCDTTTVDIVVDGTIDAVINDFTAAPVDGVVGGSAGDVTANDTLNGSAVDDTLINITLDNDGGLTGVTIDANGNVIVPADADSGNYTLTYTICEIAVPSNCDTTTVDIVVDGTIDAVINDFTAAPVDGVVGGSAGDVTANDTLNGSAVDDTLINITLDSDGGLTGVTIDANGNIIVPADADSGNYTLTYTICEIAVPSNCDTTTVDIVVDGTIDAVINDFTASPVDGIAGGTAGDVTANDTLNGNLVDDTLINITLDNDGGLTGVTIDVNGNVIVPADADSGNYTLTYTICEKAVPSNCDTTTVDIVVDGTIDAVINDFTASPVDGIAGGTAGDVTANDTLNGAAVDDTLINITLDNDGGLTGVTIDANGNVIVPADTDSGNYTLTYTICEIAVPSNCDTTTVDIVVDGTIDAAEDNYTATATEGITGITYTDILDNDTLNGIAVDVNDISVTPNTNGPLTINANGSLDVAPNTAPGTYSVTYTICEVAVPGNCDTATVTITVNTSTATPVDVDPDTVETEEDAALVVDVYGNDTYIPITGTLVTTDPANGTVVITDPNGTPNDPSDDVVTYTPDSGFSGTDSFDYTVCDSEIPQSCDTATVSVTVNAATCTSSVDTDSDGLTDCEEITGIDDPSTEAIPTEISDETDPCSPISTGCVAEITVTKIADVAGTNLGELISYSIYVENTGDYDLTEIALIDTFLDANDEILTLTSEPTFDGADLDSPEGTLLIGEIATYTATFRINEQALNAGGVSNSVSVSGKTANNQVVADISDDGDDFDGDIEEDATVTALGCVSVINEFSPNGDGYGDTLVINCIDNYPNNSLEVYNRWGNVVYKKKGYGSSNEWDGTSDGRSTVAQSEKLPVGTYYYVLDLGNGSKPKVGWLYINR